MIDLPEGWKTELYGPDHMILSAKDNKGFITVDLKNRCFRLGTITASQGGNNNYNAAPDMQQILTVNSIDTTVIDSLLAYYPFDNLGAPDTLYDLGPRHLNQKITGTTSWVTGIKGEAFNFNGTNDTIKTFDSDTSVIPISVANNFAYSFWAYPRGTQDITTETATGVGGTTAKKQWAISATHGSCKYDSKCNLDNHACAGVSVATNGITVYEGSDYYLASILVYPVTILDWTHIVIIYNNNQPTLYVNGTLVRTGLQSTHIVHPNISFSTPWWDGLYSGLIDEARIYKRSLTSAEILALYQNR